MSSTVDYKKDITKGFSQRLKQKMVEKGLVSKRGKKINQPNGLLLAKNISISSTMSNKYLNGLSIPESDTLEKIANWLEVDAWWLLYGSKIEVSPAASNFEPELMYEIFSLMHPCFNQKTNSKDFFLELVNDSIAIYENISLLNESSTERTKAITLMRDFVLKKIKDSQAPRSECFSA